MKIIESNIDFNTYKVFYAVAKYESFSKAASELYISQPAIWYFNIALSYFWYRTKQYIWRKAIYMWNLFLWN